MGLTFRVEFDTGTSFALADLQMNGYEDFIRFVRYLLQVTARQPSFVSMVFVVPTIEPRLRIATAGGALRGSDAIFDLGECSAIVMGHTSGVDAFRAVERYKTCLGGSVFRRYAVVSYPTDAITVEEILEVAQQRLGDVRPAGRGMAVAVNSG
ncbi:MAG: hypothetical protein HY706_14780 [Candidatus Hydrogenedentes bacterium]|nr:hypothetical protein [Candidatus Hydrogenedentota bacterium]